MNFAQRTNLSDLGVAVVQELDKLGRWISYASHINDITSAPLQVQLAFSPARYGSVLSCTQGQVRRTPIGKFRIAALRNREGTLRPGLSKYVGCLPSLKEI